jgi:hypothetical protein
MKYRYRSSCNDVSRACNGLPAFGLIEAAICLLLLGLVTSAGIKLYGGIQKVSQSRVTQAHQQEVANSLAAFVARTGSLPCPSQRGEGVGSSGGCAVPVGEIPHKTLGIAKNVTLDGAHQPMGYAPHPTLNNVPSGEDYLKSFCDAGTSVYGLPTPSESLQILDASHESVLDTNLGTNIDADIIAFVVFSWDPSKAPPFDGLTFYGDQIKNLYWISRSNFMINLVKTPCRKVIDPTRGTDQWNDFQ